MPVLKAVQGETLLRVLVMYGMACALAAEIGVLASSDTLSHGDEIRVVLWPRNNQSPIERVTIVESPPSSDLALFTGEIIKFEIVRHEDGTCSD